MGKTNREWWSDSRATVYLKILFSLAAHFSDQLCSTLMPVEKNYIRKCVDLFSGGMVIKTNNFRIGLKCFVHKISIYRQIDCKKTDRIKHSNITRINQIEEIQGVRSNFMKLFEWLVTLGGFCFKSMCDNFLIRF